MNEQKLEMVINKLSNCLIDALEISSSDDIVAMSGLSDDRARQIKRMVDFCLLSQKGVRRIDVNKLIALLQEN